jgi:uncharacterized membrane protein YccC
VSHTARALADAIQSEQDVPRPAVQWSGDAVRVAIAMERSSSAPSAGTGHHDEEMATILDRMAEYADTAAGIVVTLNSGAPEGDTTEPVVVEAPRLAPPRLFSLAAIVRPGSMVLHHALRVATVTSVAVLITELLHLNHGYWATLTVVVILQPFAGATRQKALQRVIGTVLGGIVAAVLSTLFHYPVAILTLIALFTAACVALLPLNYGAYAVFGTPAFVLLAEASAGDWHLAGLRILNTLLGGGLALAGSELLWPSDEWNRLPEDVASAVRANLDYLQVAIDMMARGRDANIGLLRDARRNIAIAASNGEESFQRMLGEQSGPVEQLEPIMAVLVYTRRFAASIAALAIAGSMAGGVRRAALAVFERAAVNVLEDLADAVTRGRRPAPFPPIGSVNPPGESMPPLVRVRVTRLARQLRMLHDAVDRWLACAETQAVVA